MIQQAPGAPVKTVWVVEDDEQIATLLDYLFTREGYQVICAKDGRQAQELIRGGTMPQLVMLDVVLPYASGFELLGEIRSNQKWNEVPVIMLTGHAREQDIVQGLEAGANDYIAKPFQPRELIARIRRTLH